MPTQLHKIALRSYAKINLGLHILGRRTDGYHEVRTVLQTIGLHDRLILTRKRTRGIQFSSNEPGIDPADNLVGPCHRGFPATQWRLRWTGGKARKSHSFGRRFGWW